MSAEIPTQWTHDVKLESTAKGIRIHVHVYANESAQATDEAFKLYKFCVERAKGENIPVAPMEVDNK